jgi:light-regulated signal transduction histidine kinase (bacteriophytochrome)
MQGRHIEWQLAPLPKVEADESLMLQVWTNLLSNAVKYTRPRNPARIEVGCEDSSSSDFVFFVRDNGVGFDMRYADKLFGVFQRLHRAQEFEGTGIGLANVRRIINRHGGNVWAEGKPDAGATISFTLRKPATANRRKLTPLQQSV